MNLTFHPRSEANESNAAELGAEAYISLPSPVASPSRIYLIRHGETAWNTSGRWQGELPVPLNNTGREQARKLGQYIEKAGIVFDSIYSSDLPRAAETAAVIANLFSKAPILDWRWRELNIGNFQGLTQQEIIERYPAEFEQLLADPIEYVIPGGESRRQLQSRAYAALSDLVEVNELQQSAVVTHSGTIRMLMLRLFENLREFENEHIPNTSITTVELTSRGWQLVKFAQTPHLASNENYEIPSSGVYF